MRKNRKQISIVLTLCLCCCLIASQVIAAPESADTDAAPADKTSNPSMQDVRNEVQNSINEMVTIMGTVMSGMATGMQEGAEKAQAQIDGADGTRLVANKKDLAALLHVSVLKSEEQEKGAWRVTLAIKNTNDFPVRLVNLTRKQSLLMLDADGFAHEPIRRKESARTLTIAARTAVKAAFDFVGLEAKPGVIRLFDADIPVQ